MSARMDGLALMFKGSDAEHMYAQAGAVAGTRTSG